MISKEVKIDLDVFGPLMLNMIRGHVYIANIVPEDKRGTGEGSMELVEKMMELSGFSNNIGDCLILHLGT
jgi:hypothetical protein